MISDLCFLLALTLIWIMSLFPELRQSDWCCIFISFMMQLTGSSSLWLMLFVTTDRLVFLKKPTILKGLDYLQNPIVAALITIVVFYICTAVSLNQSLLLEVLQIQDTYLCLPRIMTRPSWDKLSLADVIFNFAIVHGCILLTNTLNYFIIKNQYYGTFSADLNHWETGRHLARRSSRSEIDIEHDLTKVSIAIGYWFLLLTIPSHILRFVAGQNRFDSIAHVRLYVWQQLMLFPYVCRTISIFPVCALSCSIIRKATALICMSRRRRIPINIELVTNSESSGDERNNIEMTSI